MEKSIRIDTLDHSGLLPYWHLLKPGVMSLAILSAVAGALINIKGINLLASDIWRIFWGFVCIIVGAGASGALNMCFEIEIDSQMSRTSKRPLPSKALDQQSALELAIALAFFSVFFMALFVNMLSAGLLAFTIFFYAIIYTKFLKPRTIYNIVIGGVPGAIPPMIGEAIVQNYVGWSSFVMALIIFFWIPPHSWALSMSKVEEYRKVNIPMMNVIKGRKYTIDRMNFYSIGMILSSYLLYFVAHLSVLYLGASSILNILFVQHLFRLFGSRHQQENKIGDKKLFIFSINYLMILLFFVIFDGWIL